MEGARHPGMAMPLSVAEVAHNIVQQNLANPDSTAPQKLDLVFEPNWAQGYLPTTYPLDLIFPSDEVILEALIGLDRP
jgi:hypothetical protein